MGIGDPGTPEERFNRWVRKELSDLRALLTAAQEEIAALRAAQPPSQRELELAKTEALMNPAGSASAADLSRYASVTAAAAEVMARAVTRVTLPPPPRNGPATPYSSGLIGEPLHGDPGNAPRMPPRLPVVLTRERKP